MSLHRVGEVATIEPAAQALIAGEKARLLAKGFPATLVDSAIRRADGRAKLLASRLSAEKGRQAYLLVLEAELVSSEAWVVGFARSVTQ